MKKAYTNRLFLGLSAVTIPFPFLANEFGWITAEVGRQPWIVYNLLRTSEGYSATVPAVRVLLSIVMFTVIYALLFITWIFLLRKEVVRGPEAAPGAGAAGQASPVPTGSKAMAPGWNGASTQTKEAQA